jgi:beta-galactosidase GanA
MDLHGLGSRRSLLSVFSCAVAGLLLVAFVSAQPGASSSMPHLERHGGVTQLVLDGKPFLMLAAELHNSSSSSLDYMKDIWPRLAATPMNTVLTPLSWELIEPQEGKYDFALVDGLLEQARQNRLKVVFLWLASWKNGMSSYAPLWVKRDTRRFPRAALRESGIGEVLSTFGEATMQADARAFAAVMRHLRETDNNQHTVLMMQVENEVGVLGDSRDRSAAASKAFEGLVPKQLLNYMQQHRDTLIPEFREIWQRNGFKQSGTWREVFGSGLRTDQIFMAWNYGRYVQHVAAAGKAEYPLPMYVNTWLGDLDTPPGKFPSGGPLPEVIDVWRAAGEAIDIYSPDIYAADFAGWCRRYHRSGNPLFIPETRGGADGKANVFYAIGEHSAMGFAPFGIDSWRDRDNELGKSYEALMQLAPEILKHQRDGNITGFLLNRTHSDVSVTMNGYRLDISLDDIFGNRAETGYGLIMGTGPDEFLGAGSGFRVSFVPDSPGSAHAGINFIEEGRMVDGTWRPGRRLNGDENDQGRYWRFSSEGIHVERTVVYRWE